MKVLMWGIFNVFLIYEVYIFWQHKSFPSSHIQFSSEKNYFTLSLRDINIFHFLFSFFLLYSLAMKFYQLILFGLESCCLSPIQFIPPLLCICLNRFRMNGVLNADYQRHSLLSSAFCYTVCA